MLIANDLLHPSSFETLLLGEKTDIATKKKGTIRLLLFYSSYDSFQKWLAHLKTGLSKLDTELKCEIIGNNYLESLRKPQETMVEIESPYFVVCIERRVSRTIEFVRIKIQKNNQNAIY